MALRIDKRLNLVLPIEDDGGTLYVHSTPISREVFERYWAVLSRTANKVFTVAGNGAPRVAASALREVATELGEWEDRRNGSGEVTRPGVQNGLLAEIRRLTNVVVQTEAGWTPLPLDVAVQRRKIDADANAEVENLIVFFTVASWMNRKGDLPVLYETLGLWNARAVSSNSSEFASSLKTSTGTDSSGPQEESSATPSTGSPGQVFPS